MIRKAWIASVAWIRDSGWPWIARPGLLFLVGGLVSIPIILWLPEWMVNQYARSGALTRDQYTKHVDDYRKTVAQIIAGVGGLYGLHLVWRRTRVTEHNRLTDVFTKAIEQLGKVEDGKPNIEVRLGGIYALERLAIDSPRDHWTIMEVLSAYIRRNAAWDQERVEQELLRLPSGEFYNEVPTVSTDIQAILTVLGRRRRGTKRERKGLFLNLVSCDLRNANLAEAHFEGAFFAAAHLEGASFAKAHLERAHLMGTHLERACLDDAYLEGTIFANAHLKHASFVRAKLEGANLQGAHLEGAFLANAHLKRAFLMGTCLKGANLGKAHLEGAYLGDAQLQDADLGGAQMQGAYLRGANLQGAQQLTVEQIKAASNWEYAHYDAEFRRALGLDATAPAESAESDQGTPTGS